MPDFARSAGGILLRLCLTYQLKTKNICRFQEITILRGKRTVRAYAQQELVRPDVKVNRAVSLF